MTGSSRFSNTNELCNECLPLPATFPDWLPETRWGIYQLLIQRILLLDRYSSFVQPAGEKFFHLKFL
jgi:hypothetical protein